MEVQSSRKAYKFVLLWTSFLLLVGVLYFLFSFFHTLSNRGGTIEQLSNYDGLLGFFRRIVNIIQPFSFNLRIVSFLWDGWEFVVYVVLFIGFVYFIKTQGKKTSLLKFVYSLLFFSAIFYSCISFYTLLADWSGFVVRANEKGALYFYRFLGIGTGFIYIWLGYKALFALSKIDSSGQLIPESEDEVDELVDVSKGTRFWHFVLDSWIVFSFFFTLLSYDFVMVLAENVSRSYLNDRLTVALFIVVFRIVYYTFFEFIFGATPAKFLTKSRVVGNDGERLFFSRVFVRAIARHIPFEPFSFLFGKGWHDSLSNTRVVKAGQEK